MNPTPAVIAAIGELLRFIITARQKALQNKEWTPEQQQAFSDHIEQEFTQPHWQPGAPGDT